MNAENYYQELKDDAGIFFVLADGTALVFHGNAENLKIRADIDGQNKGSTTAGVDIFDFCYSLYYGSYGLRPSACDFDSEGSPGYDTKWVINFGNMDYLKCASKLNWTNQTSCK